MPRLFLRAVIAGTVLNLLLLYGVSIAMTALLDVDPAVYLLPIDEPRAALIAVTRAAPGLLAIHAVLGWIAVFAAGVVAGRLAGEDGAHNGAASAYAFTLLCVYGLVTGGSVLPVWLSIVALTSYPIVAALGGARGERSARGA